MEAAPGELLNAGKLFIGGLNWETTTDGLRKKLEEWGKLTDIVIMKDKHTNRPRGFGFVTFEDAAVADKLALQKHVEVDGRMVEVKRAIPRMDMTETSPSNSRSRKVFAGGLAWGTTDEQFRQYFQRFGRVESAQIMRDRAGKPRGFGFVTFEDPLCVETVVGCRHELGGRSVEVKRAVSREVMRDLHTTSNDADGAGSWPHVGPGQPRRGYAAAPQPYATGMDYYYAQPQYGPTHQMVTAGFTAMPSRGYPPMQPAPSGGFTMPAVAQMPPGGSGPVSVPVASRGEGPDGGHPGGAAAAPNANDTVWNGNEGRPESGEAFPAALFPRPAWNGDLEDPVAAAMERLASVSITDDKNIRQDADGADVLDEVWKRGVGEDAGYKP